MNKPLFWLGSALLLVLLFYFSMDGGLWHLDSSDYDNSGDQNEDSLDARQTDYFTMRGLEIVTYERIDGNWESERSDPIPYSFLTVLEIISDNDPSVSDTAKVMAWMFFYASIAQFFACISFLCSCYHHLRVQMDYNAFRQIANVSLIIVFLLPLLSGIYFFVAFPNAVENDTNFFSGVNEDSESFFGSITNSDYNTVFTWRPAIFYFVYTFFIPAIAVGNLIGYTPENVESYYSDATGSEFGENFMELPDHDDESHVSFREAVGYGASTITYWIGYIFVVALIGTLFSIISVWLMSKNTVTSWILVSVFGFFYFILSFALVLAISYKYLSDIRLRGNQSLVNKFSGNAKSLKKASPLRPLAKPATLVFDKKEKNNVDVSCPECSYIISVKSTGKEQELKCPECGLKGEITV